MAIQTIVFDAYGTLYDVQSIATATEAAFPGHGETITQIWRLKQLEYSWLRSMMGRYEDFQIVTRDALRYSVDTLGLDASAAVIDDLVAAYDALSPYPEAAEALAGLGGHRLAILSNGSQTMLDSLARHSRFDHHFAAIISVDAAKAYKPDPRAYALVQQRLGLSPETVMFVTANGFDTAGARSFGFNVVRIERISRAAVKARTANAAAIGPAAMYSALRMRTEELGFAPHVVVDSLSALPALVTNQMR